MIKFISNLLKKKNIVPSEIKQFLNRKLTENKQMMLLDTGLSLAGSQECFFSLIIKDSDNAIKKIGKNPTIIVAPFLINLSFAGDGVSYLFLLLRFNDDNELLYETNFNLASSDVSRIVKKFIEQRTQQIIVVGDKEETVIQVDLTMACAQLSAVVQRVEERMNWSNAVYAQLIPIIFSKYTNTLELWQDFQ